ncbi:cutinase family protein [Mycolicibacterium llatzerense]|uniref:cutinase family protein n=1 Tax=Mycolicibacterium llatzerense TaxID=280871 RepID=UPI0021B4E0DD|nr:cutinase family protein [Mycolicibacterium llatzerense]MCT7372003.1 serine esterase [Mycolicibacterium llatzerense]
MLFRHVRSSGVAGASAVLRWAGLGASVLLTVAAPLVIPSVAAADDCPDAEVIFARGTDEPVGMGRVGDALVDSLRSKTSGLVVRSYAVNYKATITQRHSGEGAKDAIARVKSTVAECPNTKIVLGGYSQGASVVNIVAGFSGINWGDPLPSEYVKNIAAVATFGNQADRTDGAPPTQKSPLSAKAIDLCNPADPICHAGAGNSWSGHTQGYVPEYTDQAASFVASALLAGTARTLPGYGSQFPAYGPQPGPGPQAGYGALPGPPPAYGTPPGPPQTDGTPPGPQTGYGLQPPSSVPPVSAPTSSSPGPGLV